MKPIFNSKRLAYFEEATQDLKQIEWNLYETGWGSEDMPEGTITTMSYDPKEVREACIAHYEKTGTQWPGINAKSKNVMPREHIEPLEIDAYEELDRHVVDFCKPGTNKKKVEFYCNEITKD